MNTHLKLSIKRKEYGSDFHWLSCDLMKKSKFPWKKNAVYYGSGRDALKALLLHGQKTRRWQRLWIPSYFCQEVVSSILESGIIVTTYPFNPVDSFPNVSGITFRPGDVMLRVNIFGMRKYRSIEGLNRQIVEVIEDHSHDPWSEWAFTSDADFCFASLRKVLPVPDGGVIWSPLGFKLPPFIKITHIRLQASLMKLTAMLIKRLYLEGHNINKSLFLNLSLSGEAIIASGNLSGISDLALTLIEAFPIELWRECRLRNHRVLSERLNGLSFVKVLPPDKDPGVCPFSGILVFNSENQRDYVREALIESRIYPAILWPLENKIIEGIFPSDINFSKRMLSLHCDMRYSESDMVYIASIIRKIGCKSNK